MKTLKKTLAVLMAVLMLFSTFAISAFAAEGDATTVAYFVNTDNWTDVYSHIWSEDENGVGTAVDGGWPGAACTTEDNYVYSVDMLTATHVLFHNNNGTQTANLTAADAAGKYYEPKTAAFYATAEEATAAAEAYVPPQPAENTVYFVNTMGWTEVAAYAWTDTTENATWPGEVLTPVEGTDNVYAYTTTLATVIFNNNNNGAETEHINATEGNGKYYEAKTKAFYATAEEALEAVAQIPTTAPPKTEIVKFEPTPLDKMDETLFYFIVAGDESLFGTNWDAADRNNELVYNEETRLYEKTYTGVADGTYQFKVTTGGVWDNADFNLVGDAKFGGPNAVITVPEADSTVKIVFDYQRAYVWINDVQVEVEVAVTEPTDPSATEEVKDTGYCLIGYINGANYGDQDDSATIGNVFADDNTFVYTFTENSYVCVKDTANENWYMTAGFLGEEVTSATLHNTKNPLPEGVVYDKLFVPAGTFEFTLVENPDGTLTLSYAETTKVPTTTEPSESTTPSETEATTPSETEATNPSETENTEPTEPAKKMTAKAGAKKIAAGKTTTVKVTNNNGKVTFKSSNAKVAKVSAKGVVTALTKGKATITAKDKAGNTAKVTINVTSSPKLSKKSVSVKVKKNTTITVKGAATKVKVAKCKVATFKVKNNKITVTGKKKGTATVKVTVNGVKLNLKVTVKKK